MKNDGGSAFPDHIDESAMHVTDIPGMTLRDWFAGQVLVGLYAAATHELPGDDEAADIAYAQADSMIAEREK